MKRYFLLFSAILCIALCSCNFTPSNNPAKTDTETKTPITETNENDNYRFYLYGGWIAQNGETEPIDEHTVNGTPYTIKDIVKDERGDLTFTLSVGNSNVTYKVYRYKVGYAEYSYMEAILDSKDAVFKFHK